MHKQIMNSKRQAVHHVIEAPLNIIGLRCFQIIKRLNDPRLVLLVVENLKQVIEQSGLLEIV